MNFKHTAFMALMTGIIAFALSARLHTLPAKAASQPACACGSSRAKTAAKQNPQNPHTNFWCLACDPTLCTLDDGEAFDRTEKYPTKTCVDWDGDNVGHCCDTELQVRYINIFVPMKGWTFSRTCDQYYCPGAGNPGHECAGFLSLSHLHKNPVTSVPPTSD